MYALYKNNMQKSQQEMNNMADKRESSVKMHICMSCVKPKITHHVKLLINFRCIDGI